MKTSSRSHGKDADPVSRHRALAIQSRRRRAVLAPLPVLAMIAIGQVSAGVRVAAPTPDDVMPNAQQLSGRIDPNVVPWFELTILPRVGEIIAKRIVAERESRLQSNPNAMPFRSADDLDAVHGIGPKTVDRLRDLVTLPDQRTDGR